MREAEKELAEAERKGQYAQYISQQFSYGMAEASAALSSIMVLGACVAKVVYDVATGNVDDITGYAGGGGLASGAVTIISGHRLNKRCKKMQEVGEIIKERKKK